MESAIEDPVSKRGEEIEEDPVPRKNSFERKGVVKRGGGGYVSVTWRLAIGYSGYPLETRPTLFSADGNFEKAILPISTFAEFRDGRGGGFAFEVREKVMRMRGEGEGSRRERKVPESGWVDSRGRTVNERRQIN